MKVASVSVIPDPLCSMQTGDGYTMLAGTLTATPETAGTRLSVPTIRRAPKNVPLTELINRLGRERTEFKPMEVRFILVSSHRAPTPRTLDRDLS